MTFDAQALCGWVAAPERVAAFDAMPEAAQAAGEAAKLDAKGIDTFLWKAIRECHPTWQRGSQGTGDCVSWGAELDATCLLAIQHKLGVSKWIAEAATEPIYGGARVEANGGRLAGYRPGSSGIDAANWLTKWGVLLRIDYSEQTGNKEHDLRKYSTQKADNWGNFGCGGQKDERGEGLLDKVARQYPVKSKVKLTSTKQLAGLIENGYPATIASGKGFGNTNKGYGSHRDENGIVRICNTWHHQMAILGVRYRNGKPDFRIFQSWGESASGPDPGIDWDAVSKCSWWATESDTQAILNEGDSWAFSDIAGFKPRGIDWLNHGLI